MEALMFFAFVLVLCPKDNVFAEHFKQPINMNMSSVTSIMYRAGLYPTRDRVERFTVPESLVPWSVKWDLYKPPYYTSKTILRSPWADPEQVSSFHPKWNEKDELVNRKSVLGRYDVVDGYPLNPTGRTGIKGRGALARWGPNQEASLIVTRWKRNPDRSQCIHELTKLPVLEALLVKVNGTSKWNFPKAFVNPNEKVLQTVKRIFFSQAVLSVPELLAKSYSPNSISKRTARFFLNFKPMNADYSIRPENTDNAWIENIALHFHDKTGKGATLFPLKTWPNKANLIVSWREVTLLNSVTTFYSCGKILERIALEYKSHWLNSIQRPGL